MLFNLVAERAKRSTALLGPPSTFTLGSSTQLNEVLEEQITT